MGTSLSGLTPATTFDGLLKTSDNDAITSSLKTIGSGDGTDSCLQLSDSALKVNGGQVTIVGIGNTDATTSLLVQNSDGDTLLKVVDDGEVRIGETTGSLTAEGNNVFLRGTNIYFRERLGGYIGNFREEGFQIGNGSAAATAKLQVKGSGATSATTSLLVQNSSGDDIVSVTDDGATTLKASGASNTLILDTSGGVSGFEMRSSNGQQRFRIQGTSTTTRFTPNNSNDAFTFVGNGIYTSAAFDIPSARLHVKGQGATSATTALLVQNSAGTELFKLTDDGTINLGVPGDNPTIQSGSNAGKSLTLGSTATLSALNINLSTYDGINYSPVLSVTGNTDQFVGIGEPSPTARLHVKGAGNDATTTSLLVQNSDGDDMLVVKDDRSIETYDATGNVITKNNAGNRRFEVNPNLTSLVDFQVGGNGLSNLIRTDSGLNSVGIGIGGLSNTRLYIKSSGATSATTALLVQNSDGDDMLFVTDDKIVNARQNLRVHHNSVSSRYTNISWGSLRANDTGTELSLYGGGYSSVIYLNGSTKSTAAGATGIQSTGVLIAASVSQSSFDPEDSAQLQVDSTTKGFLPPRMTGEQIDAIESPASGLIIYNTTTNKAVCYNGTSWNDMF